MTRGWRADDGDRVDAAVELEVVDAEGRLRPLPWRIAVTTRQRRGRAAPPASGDIGDRDAGLQTRRAQVDQVDVHGVEVVLGRRQRAEVGVPAEVVEEVAEAGRDGGRVRAGRATAVGVPADHDVGSGRRSPVPGRPGRRGTRAGRDVVVDARPAEVAAGGRGELVRCAGAGARGQGRSGSHVASATHPAAVGLHDPRASPGRCRAAPGRAGRRASGRAAAAGAGRARVAPGGSGRDRVSPSGERPMEVHARGQVGEPS